MCAPPWAISYATGGRRATVHFYFDKFKFEWEASQTANIQNTCRGAKDSANQDTSKFEGSSDMDLKLMDAYAFSLGMGYRKLHWNGK